MKRYLKVKGWRERAEKNERWEREMYAKWRQENPWHKRIWRRHCANVFVGVVFVALVGSAWIFRALSDSDIRRMHGYAERYGYVCLPTSR